MYLRCLSWAFSISSLAFTEVIVSTVFPISFSKEYATQLAAPTGNESTVSLNVLSCSHRASICKHLCEVLKFSNHSNGEYLMLQSVTSTSKACIYIPTDKKMGKGKAGSFLYCILSLIIQIRVIQTSNCAHLPSGGQFANNECDMNCFRPGLINLLCGVGNLWKIWSPCRQHENQYTEKSICKLICIFPYIICNKIN